MGSFTTNLLTMGIPFDKFVNGVKMLLIVIFVIIVILDIKSIYSEKKKKD
jgi:hypothetical protein